MNKFCPPDDFVHAIPMPAFIVDAEGTILQGNVYAARFLNLSKSSEVVGRTISSFYEYPEDWEILKKRLTVEREVHDFEVFYKTSGGDRIATTESVRFIQEDGGEIKRIIIISRDITLRLQMEQRLMRTNIELSEANENLQRMQQQLVQEKNMATLGTLAAGMAHEINNPLSFVQSNMETAQEYIEKALTGFDRLPAAIQGKTGTDCIAAFHTAAEQIRKEYELDYIHKDFRELFSEINKGIARIQEIVSSLDIFEPVETEQPQETRVENAIKSALAVTQAEYAGSIEIEVETPPLPPARGTTRELAQAFVNILLNAFEAVRKQENDNKPKKVRIRTYRNEEWICCEIINFGPPIENSNIPRLFDPFFTTKDLGTGKGLGLAAAYQTVVHHFGGQIDVHSSRIETGFIIRLHPAK